MLSLDQLKVHLKISPADTSQDSEVAGYLSAALGTFRKESKRRWPAEGEPAVLAVVDPLAEPVTYRFVSFVDPAVLSEDEQEMALQWVRLMVGHWFENRQDAVTDTRVQVAETPKACTYLMNLLRESTL